LRFDLWQLSDTNTFAFDENLMMKIISLYAGGDIGICGDAVLTFFLIWCCGE